MAIPAAMWIAGATIALVVHVSFSALPQQGPVRYLVWAALASTFIRSLITLCVRRAKTGARDTANAQGGVSTVGQILAVTAPVGLVLVIAAIALLGGVGLDMGPFDINAYKDTPPGFGHGPYIRPGDEWNLYREMPFRALWKVFYPPTYYTMSTREWGVDVTAPLVAHEFGHFRPLKYFTLWFMTGSPLAASLVVVGLHAVNTSAIAFLCLRWGNNASIAGLAAALFAAHPLTWIGMDYASNVKQPVGATVFVAAVICYEIFVTTKRRRWIAVSALLFAGASFATECYLGAGVLIILLTWVFLRSGRLSPPLAWRTGSVLVGSLVLATAVHVAVMTMIAPWNRFPMLHTGWKRPILAAVVDMPFAFVRPLEDHLDPWTAAVVAIPVVLLTVLIFSQAWSPYSAAAWISGSFLLGPALAIFEMVGGWSGGRLAYGPSLVFALAWGTMNPDNEATAWRIRLLLAAAVVASLALTLSRMWRFGMP